MTPAPDALPGTRLSVVPATVALLDAELTSPAQLGALLGAAVPEGWPPGEYDRGAMEFFRDRLAAQPDAAGWYGWYALLRVPSGPPVLVGAGGYLGPPDPEGVVEVGYSIVPAYSGQGLATDLLELLVARAFATGAVRRVIAYTSRANLASRAVLRKAGFDLVGPGRDAGSDRYARSRPAAPRASGT